MKKTLSLILTFFLIFPFIVGAEDFKVDMSFIDVVNKYDSLNVGSLAVGEKGLVVTYGLKMCVDKDVLKVATISELEMSPSKYSYVFEVIRNPNDKVTILFSQKGKKPDEEAVKNAILSVARAMNCEEIIKEKIPLLSVDTFLGASSLKQLTRKTGPTITQIKKEEEISTSEVENTLNDWIVSETKSPIDDSPTVTMIKLAESGDQALILRCKENTTDAYIKTNDYLGEESTTVTIRFDSETAQKQKLSLSTDNKALFFSPAITSIKKMMASENVIFRYNTYNGTPNTVSFKMSNLKNKSDILRAACHW